MFKRLMNQKWLQLSLAWCLALYMRLVRRTTRWQINGLDVLGPLQKSGQGFIACAWHSRFMMTTAGWSEMPQLPHVLISKSRDGNLVAFTSKFLGLGVVRGSRKAKFKDKHKGGAGALREMISVLDGGDCIFMTPDGPRGPRMRMGAGPVKLAQLSGAPLLAYGLSTSRHILFKSWDRFMLPLPFARGFIEFKGPLIVAAGSDQPALEAAREDMEKLLNAATQSADTKAGISPVMPA